VIFARKILIPKVIIFNGSTKSTKDNNFLIQRYSIGYLYDILHKNGTPSIFPKDHVHPTFVKKGSSIRGYLISTISKTRGYENSCQNNNMENIYHA
jgi:hypothetical protein